MYGFNQLKAGYLDLWHKMKVTKPLETAQQVAAIDRAKSRLMEVQKKTGVPWYVVGCISARESGLVAGNLDFRAVLHNGERIVGTGRKTRLVPAGLGPFQTWEDAAEDALKREGLDKFDWNGEDGIAYVAYAAEKFNGFGYRTKGIPSPYLWGGTSVQQRGKYIRDGVFSYAVMDPQIGVMALLKYVMDEHRDDHPAESIAAVSEHAPFGGKAVTETHQPQSEPKKSVMSWFNSLFRKGA